MFSGEPAKDSSRYWNKKTTLLWKKENKMAYNVTRKTLGLNSLASGTCIFLLFTNVHLLQYTITAWNCSPPPHPPPPPRPPLKKKLFASMIAIQKWWKMLFYFTWTALFVLKIFKILSRLFGHVEKTAWLEM